MPSTRTALPLAALLLTCGVSAMTAQADTLVAGVEGCIVNGLTDTPAPAPTHATTCTYAPLRQGGFVADGTWTLTFTYTVHVPANPKKKIPAKDIDVPVTFTDASTDAPCMGQTTFMPAGSNTGNPKQPANSKLKSVTASVGGQGSFIAAGNPIPQAGPEQTTPCAAP